MKKYSKCKLYFKMPLSRIMKIALMGLIWGLMIVGLQGLTIKVGMFYNFPPNLLSILLILSTTGMLLVFFLYFEFHRPYKIQDMKVGSYARIHSIIHHGGVIVLVSSPETDSGVSTADLQLVFAEYEFLEEINRQVPDQKWKNFGFVVQVVAEEGDLSVSDQERGIIPLVLANCVPKKV